MECVTFDEIYRRYSAEIKAKTDAGHKVGQVREKFTEIVDAVGININLLRTYCDDDGRPVIEKTNNQTPLQFPMASIEFAVEVLKQHTSKDYKCIRRGDFDDASLKSLEFLLNGFSEFLLNLGYNLDIYLRERHHMERRLKIQWRRAKDNLISQCVKLIADAEDYQSGLVNMNGDDKDIFISYMAGRVEDLRNNIMQIYDCYSDIRSEELYEATLNEVAKEEQINDVRAVNLELLLDYKLSRDEEYQKLLQQRKDIVASYDFIKNKKRSFYLVSEKIKKLYKEHRCEVFGNADEVEEPELIMHYPYNVLMEAILYVENNNEVWARNEEEELEKTDEQCKKEQKMLEEMIGYLDKEMNERRKQTRRETVRYGFHEKSTN